MIAYFIDFLVFLHQRHFFQVPNGVGSDVDGIVSESPWRDVIALVERPDRHDEIIAVGDHHVRHLIN